MSETQKLEVADRQRLPLGHLLCEVTRTVCGARQWALRAELGGMLLASGFISPSLPGELRRIADEIDQVGEAHGK